jgi:F-type H+-transporting ATPase subunit epsilon
MALPTFKLNISKVNELLYNGDAISVTVPGADGEATVLAHHEPLIALLKKGIITVRGNDGNKEFTIEKGVCEVSHNQVTILV